MTTSDEAWKSLSGQQGNSDSASESAWQALTPPPKQAGFLDGVTQQVTKELKLPENLAHAAGVGVVQAVAAALRTGEEEWKKLADQPKQPAKPGIFQKFIEKARAKKTVNKRGDVVVYEGDGDDEVIDADVTEVKENTQ